MKKVAQRAEEILTFWFSKPSRAERVKLWYNAGPEIDSLINKQYGPLYDEIDQNKHIIDDWLTTTKGTLAYIILFDQLTRNAFRGKAKAFAYDHLALEQALLWKDKLPILASELKQEEVSFFYMPLMHAENRDVAEESLRIFEEITTQYNNDASLGALKFAKKHTDIIRKFGRYPHRNKVLGRTDTPEEIEYLKTAERFGQ